MQENNRFEKTLFIDIETVPSVYRYNDLSDEAKLLWDKKWLYNPTESAEARYQKAGIYAEFAKVVCISMGNFYNGKFYVKSIASPDEFDLLTQFSDYLNMYYHSSEHTLCAHNGKEFDFPFLCRRFLINRIKLPNVLSISGKKPWEVKLLDTMEMWKFGDYKHYTSLNLLAYVFGLPSPKDEIDGSDVARVFWEDKNLEKIKSYCSKDVITLASVFCLLNGSSPLSSDQIIFANFQ